MTLQKGGVSNYFLKIVFFLSLFATLLKQNVPRALDLHNIVVFTGACYERDCNTWPCVLESTGGFCGETATLLQSLAKVVDTREHVPPGHTWQQLQERLSIDLQRGLHGACLKQRQRWSRSTLSLTEIGAAFMATCV